MSYPNRRSLTPMAGLLIASGLLLVAGCGGNDPEPQQRPPQLSKRLEEPAANPKPEQKPVQPATVPEKSPELAEAGETFEIVGPEPRYEIVGSVSDEELLAMDFPAPGLDSTMYAVIDLPRPKPPGKPNRSFELPEGFSAVEHAGYSPNGLPLRIVGDTDDVLMALVPAGVSVMGSDEGPDNATPEVLVYLDPFYIDVDEVTLARYQVFQESVGSDRKRQTPTNESSPYDHPALGLTWSGAVIFAKWAGKDLPTEAEWEKAARGEAGFAHPWGNGRALWQRYRPRDEIGGVGSFRTDLSPYGVVDLAGNAREWCKDRYSDQGHADAAAAAGNSRLRDWQGAPRSSTKGHRVVKGNGPGWKAWHRHGAHEREHLADIGFRCVLRVSLPE